MSADGGRREVAFRVFAAEYEDADMDHRESDEERAPNYVVTPTGVRANRLFAAGVLTSVERVNDDMLRGRISDPTGAFVVYAGQYQPDAEAFLDRTEPPAYVAVTGKTRTFRPDDGDRVFTSLRPESLTAVDGETRDRFTVAAAEQTLARVATMAVAMQRPETGADLREWLAARGVQAGLAAGVPLALSHYGTTPAYLAAVRERALQAAEVVAGDRDQVDPLDVAPGEAGDADLDALADPELAGLDVEAAGSGGVGTPAGGEPAGGGEAAAGEGATGDAGTADPDATADDAGATGEAADATADRDEVAADDAGEASTADPDLGDDRYELDDEERERIESEHGTDFSTAAEVDEPGAADIDVPDDGPSGDDGDADEGAEQADDGDDELEEAAVDAMAALDDGDGAARGAVVERVREETGADEDAVEAAIREALMDGRCYEPDDGTLKPI